MLWTAFCWHDLGPLVLLEAMVTENQYKIVLSDPFYPVMKHFYRDGSGHQILTQLNICGRSWTDMLESVLHHHHHIIPPVEFQRLVESTPRSIKVVLAAHGVKTPY